MGRKRFHQLKRIKFRATWNKINLYNLSRLTQGVPSTKSLTFYQQKWKAKSITRAYHGEQIREKQWQRMFTPRLNAVVPMDHLYLAEHDGSELASGRGSGKAKPLVKDDEGKLKKTGPRLTPYAHQTYAPIERRLDMSIWRSLFASSARQARQFVVHGKVKVNGKKMIYPGYLLNPGDMFQVEPEAVLFATGAPKTIDQLREGRYIRRIRRRRNVGMDKLRAQMAERRAAKAEAAKTKNPPVEKLVATNQPKTNLQDNIEYRKARQADLTLMIDKVEKRLSDRGKLLSVKAKQGLRGFLKHAKQIRTQVMRLPFAELEKERYVLIEKYVVARKTRGADEQDRFERKLKTGWRPDGSEATKDSDSTQAVASPKRTYSDKFTKEDQERVEKRLAKQKLETVDPSKPYATPWRPRDFMSAFAFIPRYLEVNSKICSAVYLRHPVAGPGFTEVPTPFSSEIAQLAFTWYLRRR